jgi:hypothetical protein
MLAGPDCDAARGAGPRDLLAGPRLQTTISITTDIGNELGDPTARVGSPRQDEHPLGDRFVFVDGFEFFAAKDRGPLSFGEVFVAAPDPGKVPDCLLSSPPLIEDQYPVAVLLMPPLMFVASLAVLPPPPLTVESYPVAALSTPPLTAATSPLAVLCLPALPSPNSPRSSSPHAITFPVGRRAMLTYASEAMLTTLLPSPFTCTGM